MCGIHAYISRRETHQLDKNFQNRLSNRGPDHLGHTATKFFTEDNTQWLVECTSTVLALRGGNIQPQPFSDESSGSVFCWNGEAWKFNGEKISGNDGQVIFSALVEASARPDAVIARAAILAVLRSICGPFAFFFFDSTHREIYFGRDRLGRRSLLHKHTEDALELASIASTSSVGWHEVEADGIYHQELSSFFAQRDLGLEAVQPKFSKSQYSWDEDHLVSLCRLFMSKSPTISHTVQFPSLGSFNKAVPSTAISLGLHSQAVHNLKRHLAESLRLRILQVPIPPGQENQHNVRIAILFSGGLDCTVLARMAHDILPHDQHIDLLNVAFENPRVIRAAINAAKQRISSKGPALAATNDEVGHSKVDEQPSPYESCPDRETGRKAHAELRAVCPERTWRFIAVRTKSFRHIVMLI